MSKKELKLQIKDLYEVLNFYIENVENSEKHINYIIQMAKLSQIIKRSLENRESIREIKKRKLTNEYIRKFNSFDIHEALNISKKEANKKIRNFDFTTKEKNIIMNTFNGCAKDFLIKQNTKAI